RLVFERLTLEPPWAGLWRRGRRQGVEDNGLHDPPHGLLAGPHARPGRAPGDRAAEAAGMKAQSGFTLIELLVSLTLLGLLLVLLSGGLRFGTRAWEHSTAVADDGDSIRSVQNLLRREIERTCPRLLPAASQQDTPCI